MRLFLRLGVIETVSLGFSNRFFVLCLFCVGHDETAACFCCLSFVLCFLSHRGDFDNGGCWEGVRLKVGIFPPHVKVGSRDDANEGIASSDYRTVSKSESEIVPLEMTSMIIS